MNFWACVVLPGIDNNISKNKFWTSAMYRRVNSRRVFAPKIRKRQTREDLGFWKIFDFAGLSFLSIRRLKISIN